MTRLRFALILALATGLSSEMSLAAPARSAAGPAAARSTPRRAPARATRKAAPHPGAAKPTAAKPAAAKPAAASTAHPLEPAPADVAAAPETTRARTPATGTSEAKVTSTAPTAGTGVVRTEEAEKGVKTYTFGAEEVEGRLRSPQILYFLRRVRAEFDAEPLGHRSFLLELSDTRRAPSLE
ncbi:MAG: hypothetical protein RL033_5963 [Pseudomonadota bacterium]|jgi:hypothetical protein